MKLTLIERAYLALCYIVLGGLIALLAMAL